MIEKKHDINIVFCGEAGQGIETVTEILIKTFKRSEINLFSTKEYMSRIRGGVNTSDIRISSEALVGAKNTADFVFLLTEKGLEHLKNRINQDTVIFFDSKLNIDTGFKKIPVDLTTMSQEIGGKIYFNVISAGIIIGLFGIDEALGEECLKEIFNAKSQEIIQKNIQALSKGYSLGREICTSENITIKVDKDESVREKILIIGNDSVALGCIAGGCDFISSYPMSPSTGVTTFLFKNSRKFNIIAEQAEDEIAAINMGIGAWYAGARAMVSTSGGGFALMTEGVSLAGMIESPMVIHLAQRPGPATGLPTRTEQGDLELALYSGHGEFPRIILTPGNPEDAFNLSKKAFYFADKFQVPVFILTDQYLIDSNFLTLSFNIENSEPEEFITKTSTDYKRYKLTENGLSPRGIPGYGNGHVCVDSDEHDEEGHITEDLDLRVKMVNKRLKKQDLIMEEIFEPQLIGKNDYKNLIVGWGSTYGPIKEALTGLDNDETSFIYIKQVYPFHPDIIKYLEKAENTIIVENNATAQFAKLVRRETGFNFTHKILKYNGLPFYAEELKREINAIIKVGVRI
jgi:2-oxoglutarate ferredoxin oxidoreductase subunit alpha